MIKSGPAQWEGEDKWWNEESTANRQWKMQAFSAAMTFWSHPCVVQLATVYGMSIFGNNVFGTISNIRGCVDEKQGSYESIGYCVGVSRVLVQWLSPPRTWCVKIQYIYTINVYVDEHILIIFYYNTTPYITTMCCHTSHVISIYQSYVDEHNNNVINYI